VFWHAVDIHNPLARRRLRRLVEELRPDVVNTSVVSGFSTAIFRACKASGATLVHTMRDYYLICQNSGMSRNGRDCTTFCARCRVVARLRRRDARNVDLFLANSEMVAALHARGGVFPDDRPVRVQWNINTLPIRPEPRRRRTPLRLGYIGVLAQHKGLDVLAAAHRALADRHDRYTLALAGEGQNDYVARLRATLRGPNVTFLGWRDPLAFYRDVDVLVCPSTFPEPLPRVVYEAYSQGLPVIAAASGGIPEVVDDGVQGLLYPPQEVGELATRIRQVLDMPEARYRELSAGALEAAQRFSPDAVLDAFEANIANVLHVEP
jgi:glycosyltransferase involved in cell wall biosynthesis